MTWDQEKLKANYSAKINNLPADYMEFYQNTRGLHRNIKGPQIF
jgi:DNA-binding ferritin-like protein